MTRQVRPQIDFIPLSTDHDKIRFFGTLMPALLLLKASPLRFAQFQVAQRLTPRQRVADLVAEQTDDAASFDGTWLFIHRWRSLDFDPFSFADAKVFLARITRRVQKTGFSAEPLDPLSPAVNLPRLAAQAGLGNLSPFGLLVHPAFGPRLIVTGLRTDYPLELSPRWNRSGCNDCFSCLKICPQHPLEGGVVDLGQCQRCAQCLIVCPTGKGLLE